MTSLTVAPTPPHLTSHDADDSSQPVDALMLGFVSVFTLQREKRQNHGLISQPATSPSIQIKLSNLLLQKPPGGSCSSEEFKLRHQPVVPSPDLLK